MKQCFVQHSFMNIFQTELALQLSWAIGEYGGGSESQKDAARELFESLELLLYENLSSRYIRIFSILLTW